MVANQSIGSFSEPLDLKNSAASPPRLSSSDPVNPTTIIPSPSSSWHHHSHVYDSHSQCPSFHDAKSTEGATYLGHRSATLVTAAMSRSSSHSSSASRSTACTTSATTAITDAKKLHKHHKHQQQEVVLKDGPSKGRYRHAALRSPRARFPAGGVEDGTSSPSSITVVGSGSGGGRGRERGVRGEGGEGEGGEDEEDEEEGRGRRRRRRQQRRKSQQPGRDDIKAEQDGGVFEKTMDKCSSTAASHRLRNRKQGGGSTIDTRVASSTEPFGGVFATTPKPSPEGRREEEEGGVQERQGHNTRDYFAESQQQHSSAVPPLSTPPLQDPHLTTHLSSFHSSFSSSSSSHPSSPTIAPISSTASPSMSFSLSTPSSPSSTPSFQLPPSSSTSPTTATAGSSSPSSSYKHKGACLSLLPPPLPSQQQQRQQQHRDSSPSCSTTMPPLHPWSCQSWQEGQDPLVAPSSSPLSTPQASAVEGKRRSRHGKQHSFSFRMPSRTKSLLSLVGRSRATTMTGTTLSQPTAAAVVDPASTSSEYLSPLDPPSSLSASETDRTPHEGVQEQTPLRQAYPQQLPDADDLAVSLAPRPQQLPQGRKNSRQCHQHSHSLSHSQDPSYQHSSHQHLHHHHQYPRSAFPDEFRIHHPRSASMSSPLTATTTNGTTTIPPTTGPHAGMGSPSSRHSIVFPLDGAPASSSSVPPSRPAPTARSTTAPRPTMDFDMLQQQRLQQAAAALIATAAAASSSSSPTSTRDHNSTTGGRRGRVVSSTTASSSSTTSPCTSSSSSIIATTTNTNHPIPPPFTTTTTTDAPTCNYFSTTTTTPALTLTPTTTTTTTTTAADPWRDQWLGPSGAMQSLFRDRPSKFNCPHCGARRVRSHIEFVPGVMSFLVSFGLLFLTVGTLSFLPFRKDHKATKDCVHWCPRCETRVARFVRASGTWEWM